MPEPEPELEPEPIPDPCPKPSTPDGSIIYDNDSETYLELDENGTPLGKWIKNEDGEWIFEEYLPLSDFTSPQTSDSRELVLWSVTSGISLLTIILMLYLKRRKKIGCE